MRLQLGNDSISKNILPTSFQRTVETATQNVVFGIEQRYFGTGAQVLAVATARRCQYMVDRLHSVPVSIE